MGFHLTTTQSAEFLTEQLATNGGTPTITSKKVHAQVQAGLFNKVRDGKQVRIDSDDLLAFAQKTRYVQDPAEIDSEVFRVSLLEWQKRDEGILERGTKNVLGRFTGVDYTNPQRLDGIEGAWHASDVNCEFMVATNCTFLATCKGYVHPEHVRTVINWHRIDGSSRKYFVTAPAPESVRRVVGTGLWIDVPPGRESDFLVKNAR